MLRTDDLSGPLTAVSDLPVATILESIPDAVVVVECDTDRVVAANRAAAELFGRPAADLVGLDRTALHPADSRSAYETAFSRASGDGQVDRLPDGSPVYVETADGGRTPVAINAQRIQSGGRSLVLGVFRDVSDRLDRQRQLEETTTRLETLLDSTPFPVAVLDAGGRIQVWNRAAESTFGYTPEEIIGKFYPLSVEDEQLERLLARLLDGEPLEGYETEHRAKDGSLLDVEIYAQPLYDGEQVTGIIGSAIDITDRKRRRQRLDVLHRLLRHNLRNRVTVIRGHASALVAGTGTDPDAAAEQIIAASDDLAELSDKAKQTRDLVRISPTEANAIEVAELLATAAELESSVAEATIEVSGPRKRASVPPQTSQSLTWLLAHVVEYAQDPTVELGAMVQDRHVRVDIDGSSQLLSPGHRELITNGEETALKHGSGLDVARSYLTLTSLGGGVSLPDPSDSGHSIRIEIPRADIGEAA